jgi:hypothetical protein
MTSYAQTDSAAVLPPSHSPNLAHVTMRPSVADSFSLSNGKTVRIPRGVLARPHDVVQRVPIEIVAGLAFARVTVDGKEGLFILDTGNPVLILNTAHVTPGPVIDSAIVSDAVGRNVPVLVHAARKVEWAGNIIEDVGALGMDLSAVAAQLSDSLKGRPIMGMFGLAQLAHFIPVFDYKARELVLYPLDASDAQARLKLPPPTSAVPLLLTQSGLFVSGTAGGKAFFLRLDSGDDGLGIDAAFASTLAPHITTTTRTKPTMGVGGQVVLIPMVLLDSLTIGTVTYDSLEMRSHPFPPNISNLGIGRAQGSLGSPFFARHRVGLDLRKKVLYLWDESKSRS